MTQLGLEKATTMIAVTGRQHAGMSDWLGGDIIVIAEGTQQLGDAVCEHCYIDSGTPECTKIAHRHSPAIFTADSGIAGNSPVGISFQEGFKWGMGWVVVGKGVFGVPRFWHLFVNALFSRVLAKNRGAPKTTVPTTAHPIPHLTPSEFCPFESQEEPFASDF